MDPKELGLTGGDFEVARQLAEFMKTMAPQAVDNPFVNGTTQDQGFSGVPVRWTSFRNCAVESGAGDHRDPAHNVPADDFRRASGLQEGINAEA